MLEETIELACPMEVDVSLTGSEVVEVAAESTSMVVETGCDVAVEMPGYSIELNAPGSGSGDYEEDNTLPPEWQNPAPPPTVVRNLTTLNGFTTISLYWLMDWYAWHKHVEIWRAEVDDMSFARKVGTAADNAFVDSVESGKAYFYWARPVTQVGVVGEWNALAGTPANSIDGVDDFLEALQGKLHQGLFDLNLQGALNNLGSLSGALLQETQERLAAIAAEQAARRSELQQWLNNILLDRNAALDGVTSIAITAVNQETLQRVTQDEAFVLQINDLLAAVVTERDQRIAAITEERQALTNSNLSQALVNQELTALLDNETSSRIADIENERLVRVTELAAMATQISTVSAALNTERSERIAAIQVEQEARVTEFEAVAGQLLTISAAITDETSARQAAIAQESLARVNADSALAQSVSVLSATVDGNAALISQEQVARVSADESLSSEISTVSSSLDGVSATVNQVSQSVSSINAQGSQAHKSLWGVKATAGEVTGSVGLVAKSDGRSEFTVAADRFTVFNPAAQNASSDIFYVENGEVYLNKARINLASIDNLELGGTTVLPSVAARGGATVTVYVTIPVGRTAVFAVQGQIVHGTGTNPGDRGFLSVNDVNEDVQEHTSGTIGYFFAVVGPLPAGTHKFTARTESLGQVSTGVMVQTTTRNL